MLSHDDRRRLEEIEQHLSREDPVLARRFSTWSVPSFRTWMAILLIITGVVGGLVGVLARDPSTFVLLGLAPLGAGMGMWMSRS